MFWFSILIFFVITICLGHSITFFIKRPENWLERILMNIGFGLAAFAVLALFLNLIRIQLHWMVFVGISVVIPLFSLYKRVSKQGLNLAFPKKIGIKKSSIYILFVLVIAVVFFAVYHHGAFKYPYLEDDDPWFQAQAAKYVANYKTYSHDPAVRMIYLEPYPPSYAVLMGVLHQTNTDIIWNLKFFNVLLITLGLVFFYFFAQNFFGSRKKALFSTFLLALIPCFMSHFIWASSLAIVLFFPAFYSLERIRDDKSWFIVAGICVAGVLMSQPSNAIIFGLMMVVYWFVKVVSSKSFQKHIFFAGVIGLALAASIYYIPTILQYTVQGLLDGMGVGGSIFNQAHAASGGGLVYGLKDFMFAKTVSKMDNPIGVGVVLFFLMVFSLLLTIFLLFRKKKVIFSEAGARYLLMLAWFLFTLAGIHGNRLPVQLLPHRFWAIFAIPVVLLCAEGFFALGKYSNRIKIHRYFLYALIIAGVILTSGYPKYAVETSYWPPGVYWGSMDEVTGYFSFVAPLPDGTRVFPICSEAFKVLALDKWAEPWDPYYQEFKADALNRSAENIHSWLKSMDYEYMTLDTYCMKTYDVNTTNMKLFEIGNHSGFRFVNGNGAFFLFEVL